MKGVHCSWVDMLKIRQSLNGGKRGTQKLLEKIRCIDKSTVSTWKTILGVVEAVGDKVSISKLTECQPSHIGEIGRHCRREGLHLGGEDVREMIVGWVDLVESEHLTVQALRQRLKDGASPKSASARGRKIIDLAKLAASGRKYGCVYMDPPWSYGNQGTRAATHKHYSTLTIQQIAGLPIGDLAAEKSHLHLWTTNGFLKDAIALLEGWGFDFKSTFIWCKPQLGIGNYWRCSHEILLLGVRGGKTFPPTNIKSWVEAPRGKHSAKPEAVRVLIEKVSPGPRIELFARRPSEGWDHWGDQVERCMFFEREANGVL